MVKIRGLAIPFGKPAFVPEGGADGVIEYVAPGAFADQSVQFVIGDHSATAPVAGRGQVFAGPSGLFFEVELIRAAAAHYGAILRGGCSVMMNDMKVRDRTDGAREIVQAQLQHVAIGCSNPTYRQTCAWGAHLNPVAQRDPSGNFLSAKGDFDRAYTEYLARRTAAVAARENNRATASSRRAPRADTVRAIVANVRSLGPGAFAIFGLPGSYRDEVRKRLRLAPR